MAAEAAACEGAAVALAEGITSLEAPLPPPPQDPAPSADASVDGEAAQQVGLPLRVRGGGAVLLGGSYCFLTWCHLVSPSAPGSPTKTQKTTIMTEHGK